jgi:hypothetical protein
MSSFMSSGFELRIISLISVCRLAQFLVWLVGFDSTGQWTMSAYTLIRYVGIIYFLLAILRLTILSLLFLPISMAKEAVQIMNDNAATRRKRATDDDPEEKSDKKASKAALAKRAEPGTTDDEVQCALCDNEYCRGWNCPEMLPGCGEDGSLSTNRCQYHHKHDKHDKQKPNYVIVCVQTCFQWMLWGLNWLWTFFVSLFSCFFCCCPCMKRNQNGNYSKIVRNIKRGDPKS